MFGPQWAIYPVDHLLLAHLVDHWIDRRIDHLVDHVVASFVPIAQEQFTQEQDYVRGDCRCAIGVG